MNPSISLKWQYSFIMRCVIFSFPLLWDSLVAQLVTNPPAMWETGVWSLVWEAPLENGKATYFSIDLENSMDCTVHGVAKSWTWLNDFHFLFTILYNGNIISFFLFIFFFSEFFTGMTEESGWIWRIGGNFPESKIQDQEHNPNLWRTVIKTKDIWSESVWVKVNVIHTNEKWFTYTAKCYNSKTQNKEEFTKQLIQVSLMEKEIPCITFPLTLAGLYLAERW